MKEIILFLLAVTLLSCSQNVFDSKEEVIEFVKNPDNGYYKSKNVNGVVFALTYRPTDLLVSQELDDISNQKTIDSLREKYDGYLYLSLSLSKNGQDILSVVPKDRNEFGAVVNQLAFGFGEKVHLSTAKKDTVALLNYIYPRMYGLNKSSTLLFVYPRDQVVSNNEYLQFTIEDLGLQTGEISFKINIEDIDNEPSINFL